MCSTPNNGADLSRDFKKAWAIPFEDQPLQWWRNSSGTKVELKNFPNSLCPYGNGCFSKRFPARILINSNWLMAFAKNPKLETDGFSHRPSQNLEFSWKKLAFCGKQLASSWKSLAFCWTKTAFYWNDLVFVGNWVGMHRAIRFFCFEWSWSGNKCNVTRHPGSQVHCTWRVREDWTTLSGSLGSSKYRIEGHLFGAERSTCTKDTKKQRPSDLCYHRHSSNHLGCSLSYLTYLLMLHQSIWTYRYINLIYIFCTVLRVVFSIKDAKGQQKMVEKVRSRISLINVLLIIWPSWRWGNLFFSVDWHWLMHPGKSLIWDPKSWRS